MNNRANMIQQFRKLFATGLSRPCACVAGINEHKDQTVLSKHTQVSTYSKQLEKILEVIVTKMCVFSLLCVQAHPLASNYRPGYWRIEDWVDQWHKGSSCERPTRLIITSCIAVHHRVNTNRVVSWWVLLI